MEAGDGIDKLVIVIITLFVVILNIAIITSALTANHNITQKIHSSSLKRIAKLFTNEQPQKVVP